MDDGPPTRKSGRLCNKRGLSMHPKWQSWTESDSAPPVVPWLVPQARQATTNTFFSRKEQGSRGDASDWTDSPAERAKKADQM